MAYSTRQNRQQEDSPKPTRYYSGRQEKKVARKNKGQQTANSGAALFNSGDVKTKRFVIECKTTVKQQSSMSVKKEWIDKAKEEAFSMGREHWAIAFDMGPDSKEQYYIISEKDFKLLNQYMENDDE